MRVCAIRAEQEAVRQREQEAAQRRTEEEARRRELEAARQENERQKKAQEAALRRREETREELKRKLRLAEEEHRLAQQERENKQKRLELAQRLAVSTAPPSAVEEGIANAVLLSRSLGKSNTPVATWLARVAQGVLEEPDGKSKAVRIQRNIERFVITTHEPYAERITRQRNTGSEIEQARVLSERLSNSRNDPNVEAIAETCLASAESLVAESQKSRGPAHVCVVRRKELIAVAKTLTRRSIRRSTKIDKIDEDSVLEHLWHQIENGESLEALNEGFRAAKKEFPKSARIREVCGYALYMHGSDTYEHAAKYLRKALELRRTRSDVGAQAATTQCLCDTQASHTHPHTQPDSQPLTHIPSHRASLTPKFHRAVASCEALSNTSRK